MPSILRRRAVWSVTTLVLLWGFGSLPAAGQGEAEALSASFRKAARQVLAAVVTVRPAGIPGPFVLAPPRFIVPGTPEPMPLPRESGGSGVVIDAAKGYILTNDHVVQDAPRVVVTLPDGRERTATQVRRDPKSDLALVVIDGKGLTQADWGDSDALDTGDWVLAIGQPFGLSQTVAAGIVSGTSRGSGATMSGDLIQTDAAINPGNSGGPLVNLKGEVVGINVALKTLGGDSAGMGFAVPATRARRVAADLAEFGRVRRAYLGLQIGPIDPATAERIGQPDALAINGVAPDSPAAEAGLRRGDILMALQGQPIKGLGAFQAAIEVAPPSEPLTLMIDRDGERREVEVRPRPQPEPFGPPARNPRPLRDRPRRPTTSEPAPPPLGDERSADRIQPF